MKMVIKGKRYDTEAAKLLSDDTFADGTNRMQTGRNTFLYRSEKGMPNNQLDERSFFVRQERNILWMKIKIKKNQKNT
jgi:hypothetical protein